MDDAYINGIRLACETIGEEFPKALTAKEIPFRDRAQLQDMGAKAVTVRLRCFFYGQRYAQHRELVDLLRGRRSHELDHPEFGLMQGGIKNISVRRDDREQTAEVDIEFVEGDPEVAPSYVPAVDTGAQDLYEQGLGDSRDDFAKATENALGAAAADVLEQELDPDQGILDQLTGLTRKVREYVKGIDAAVRTYESTLNDIAIPANALIATIEFGLNLPGRVIGAAARCAHRYSLLYETSKTAPSRFVQSIADGITRLDDILWPITTGLGDAAAHARAAFKTAAALEASVQLGGIFADDQDSRRLQQRAEQQYAFDPAGRYTPPPAAGPVMSVTQIEQSLSVVRTMIADAVALSRQNGSLKKVGQLLLSHATQIKLQSEKIVSVRLDNPTPLHLVCLQSGLSYPAAERIMAINAIPAPNFIQGDIDIYAS